MQLVNRFFALAMGLLLLQTAAAAEPTPSALGDLDAFIEAEMAVEKTPGLAIAVIKDGQVIYQRGFGYRDVAHKLPVTANTTFPIASVTKSFTVLLLGSLVEAGKLDWDKPVRSYLPDFQLYDPTATEHITTRDLVSHRTGLPRHDGVWYGATVSRRQLWEGLRYLQPNADLRETYQYNNLMFVAAGYMAGELSGRPWEQLLQERLFAPLDMTGSSSSLQDLRDSAEPALGYVVGEGDKIVKTEYANIDAIAPAGAINSTLADMSRYLRMHVGEGSLDGRQLFDASLLREMRQPLISDTEPSPYPELGVMQYGMGLELGSYRGNRHVYHGGNIGGFTSFISYLPEHKVGVVMLSNLGGSKLRKIVPFRIYDRLLGMQEIDWRARLAERKALDKAAEVEPGKSKRKLPSLHRTGTRPGHPLAEYAGHYEHPAYGLITIGSTDSALTMDYHGSQAPLAHYHYEVFETKTDKLNALEGQRLQFQTDIDGDVVSVLVPMESNVPAIVFKRRADSRMRERAFLAPLAGSYKLGSDTAEVKLREDGVLIVTLSGKKIELVPISGTRFGLAGNEGQSIEFLKDADARTNGFIQYQPWGNRVAERR